MNRASEKLVCGALIASLTGVLPGCSFLFTTAPKSAESESAPQSEYVSSKCTTSKAAPIVDTVLAGFEVARTGYAFAADKSVYDNAPISREADIAFGLGFLALFGASAIYGYYVTGECSKLHHQGAVVVRPPEPEERESAVPDDPPPHPPEPPSDLAP